MIYIEFTTRYISGIILSSQLDLLIKSRYIQFCVQYIEFRTRYIEFTTRHIEFTTQFFLVQKSIY